MIVAAIYLLWAYQQRLPRRTDGGGPPHPRSLGDRAARRRTVDHPDRCPRRVPEARPRPDHPVGRPAGRPRRPGDPHPGAGRAQPLCDGRADRHTMSAQAAQASVVTTSPPRPATTCPTTGRFTLMPLQAGMVLASSREPDHPRSSRRLPEHSSHADHDGGRARPDDRHLVLPPRCSVSGPERRAATTSAAALVAALFQWDDVTTHGAEGRPSPGPSCTTASTSSSRSRSRSRCCSPRSSPTATYGVKASRAGIPGAGHAVRVRGDDDGCRERPHRDLPRARDHVDRALRARRLQSVDERSPVKPPSSTSCSGRSRRPSSSTASPSPMERPARRTCHRSPTTSRRTWSCRTECCSGRSRCCWSVSGSRSPRCPSTCGRPTSTRAPLPRSPVSWPRSPRRAHSPRCSGCSSLRSAPSGPTGSRSCGRWRSSASSSERSSPLCSATSSGCWPTRPSTTSASSCSASGGDHSGRHGVPLLPVHLHVPRDRVLRGRHRHGPRR